MEQFYATANPRIIENYSVKTALKWLAWSGIVALALYYIVRNALPYFALQPEHFKNHWSHAGWLLLHIGGGVLALLLGPFQFWAGLRHKRMQLHRWIGRLYLASIILSSLAAIYLLFIPERVLGFHLGIGGLALAWLTTSGFAYLAIRKRQIEQHKEWMIRSYVVTFGFVNYRIIWETMAAFNAGTPQERSSAASWLCWALPLLLTEAILQGRKILRSNRKQTELRHS